MKSILMSIKPKCIEKIANGEKTVEVRKTVPKCGTPFKVYMYCTKAGECGGFYRRIRDIMPIDDYNEIVLGTKEITRLDGYIVGEFVCDDVFSFENSWFDKGFVRIIHEGHIHPEELDLYIGENGGYGLHISNLKIYDKPKELSEFRSVKKVRGYHKIGENKVERLMHADRIEVAIITRPPQSWQFVEEL